LLSELPLVDLKDHVGYAQATGESREGLARQANKDWTTFLTHSAAEIVPGDKMVIALPKSMVDHAIGSVPSQYLMNQILRQMVQEGLVSRERYDNFVFSNSFFAQSKRSLCIRIVGVRME